MRSAAIVVLALLGAAAHAQESNWQIFRPGGSTQADVLHLFGVPDRVELEFEWPQFSRFQAAPVPAAAYTFKYLPTPTRPQVPMLHGPFGRASSAFVYMENGTARYLAWDYCCRYRAPAAQKWLDDSTYEVKRVGKMLVGTKRLQHGLLSVMCMSDAAKHCDGDVTVTFLKPEE